jgi:hypothetical protein
LFLIIGIEMVKSSWVSSYSADNVVTGVDNVLCVSAESLWFYMGVKHGL